MTGVSNPLENGFIASLARPGGNITGVTNQDVEAFGKLIEIFHEVAPAAARIAILLNEANPSHPSLWSTAQSACAALNMVAFRVVANTPDQFEAAAAQIVRNQAQAIAVPQDPVYFFARTRLVDAMRTTRLPAAYGYFQDVAAGGLVGYAASIRATFGHAATFVDKILKGAKPADLPVEQPTKFDLMINLKTANTLGLKIPQSVLLRADELIK